nr:hypothetical protein [Tanacetum cinerariifolium]
MRPFLLACLFGSFALHHNPTPAAQQPLLPASQPLQAAHLTARAGMMQGKYVFCYTQPTSAYDVAFTFASAYKPNEQMTLNTILSASMAGALMESGAQLKAFDAIIIQDGARDVAIKFKSDVVQANYGLATVQRHGGFPVFLFCEPVDDYKVVKNEKISWYNHAFGGAYYPIAHVQDNLVKTANKNKDTEAIL